MDRLCYLCYLSINGLISLKNIMKDEIYLRNLNIEQMLIFKHYLL